MARIRNPFTPTFGIVPSYMAGRDGLLEDMSEAFEDGVGNPNLCTLIVGPRGLGKTALLSCIGDEAREQGWLVVYVVAEEGMLEDIIQHAQHEAGHLIDHTASKRLSGVNIGDIIGLEWETEEKSPLNWRMRMEALLRQIDRRESGLLITVDEVRVDVEEMVRLTSAYQLFVRQGHNVSLVMAGLPSNVTELVKDKRVSFLRRARRRQLDILKNADVERAFRKTLERASARIEDDALAIAVAASHGFPYMLQLVGYYMWIESDGSRIITEKDAKYGVRDAEQDFRSGILERTWREMSKGDRVFAFAMLPDDKGSTLTEVASRMGRGTNYASAYKRRLMEQGVIGERPRGTFDFDIPLMRAFLRDLQE